MATYQKTNTNKKVFMILLVSILLLGAAFLIKTLFFPDAEKPGVYSKKDDSKLVYNKNRENQRDQILASKPGLSPADEAVKSGLIVRENPLEVTDNFTITYNSTIDAFEAMVTTIRINTAKEEATQWLRSQGFSQEAICKLPVVFTITDRDAESLRGLNIIFDPLPLGC